MKNVTIADDRAGWVKKEDNYHICLKKCRYFKACYSRLGIDCKQMGGEKIPKMKKRKNSKKKK